MHGGSRRLAAPSTSAQIKARLLTAGTAAGFLIQAAMARAERSRTAAPFVPPGGTTSHACNQLTSPFLFMPRPLLDAGQTIQVPDQRKYGGLPPSWFEWIDVYPAREAQQMLAALPGLIRTCRNFTLAGTPGVVGPTPMHMTVSSLPGLGSQGRYVSIRTPRGAAGIFVAFDWAVIRSGSTLIWIDDRGSQVPTAGRDTRTLRLVRDAWHRFASG